MCRAIIGPFRGDCWFFTCNYISKEMCYDMYAWERANAQVCVKVLADVEGNIGTALSLITARYPHIKGINIDQSNMIATCPNFPGN